MIHSCRINFESQEKKRSNPKQEKEKNQNLLDDFSGLVQLKAESKIKLVTGIRMTPAPMSLRKLLAILLGVTTQKMALRLSDDTL
jgi:hypothetical protein